MKWEFEKYDHLQDAVKRFLEILNITEETNEGKPYKPNKIVSCRVHNSAEMEDVLKQMEVLSGYRQAKEMKDLGL